MKILDRYLIKNFLVGFFICLAVMLGMFLTVDLFIHLDEFAEQTTRGIQWLAESLMRYYFARAVVWVSSLGGILIVIAAAFTLARMTRNNELIAIMASGVSLKRVLAPILLLALAFNGLIAANREWLIPRLVEQLTRERDKLAGENAYDLWFVADDSGNLMCCQEFSPQTGVMKNVLIILRHQVDGVWQTLGRITAQSAAYDPLKRGWQLTNANQMFISQIESAGQIEPIDFYPSSVSDKDLPLRRQQEFKSLLSLKQLQHLERTIVARPVELADIAVYKHHRVTEPIINMVMLMLALPVLVCRDPKEMKSAILQSFLMTLICFLVVFLSSLFATEPIGGQIRPALFCWLPIFIFLPIAILRIDSMRT